jgi:hypothetical protein
MRYAVYGIREGRFVVARITPGQPEEFLGIYPTAETAQAWINRAGGARTSLFDDDESLDDMGFAHCFQHGDCLPNQMDLF